MALIRVNGGAGSFTEETQTKSIPAEQSGEQDYTLTFSSDIVGIKSFNDPAARIVSASFSGSTLSIHCMAYGVDSRTVTFTCFTK